MGLRQVKLAGAAGHGGDGQGGEDGDGSEDVEAPRVAEACGPHFETALGSADQCLYHVKNGGRDAVRHCHSPECPPG